MTKAQKKAKRDQNVRQDTKHSRAIRNKVFQNKTEKH